MSEEIKTMNIFALPGHKVMVTEKTKNNGYEYDQEKVHALLKIGKHYTVDHTTVDNSHTSVYLQEFPQSENTMFENRPCFNSVSFVDVTKQNSIDDEKHPDMQRYKRMYKR